MISMIGQLSLVLLICGVIAFTVVAPRWRDLVAPADFAGADSGKAGAIAYDTFVLRGSASG